ncbi:hypothetical protein E6B08_08140 [Pseudomonas putida]|uniref:Uncharacterized protein n=1 Tax=Pseudomonas putida TaxID=303 RepID=A0A4D6XAG0_PSEPU|nr:hypothetical protein [Pseudomonas putida]QCI11368.1 hypothetical protein E6B08_08140 [Pseudomonas putida]
MKRLHYRTYTVKQLMLSAPLLLGLVAPFAIANSELTSADPKPTLALYQTVDNSTEPACSFDLPVLGSGATQTLKPEQTCPEVEGAPIEPHSIRIRNVPIATTFLLTDNDRCEKEGSAWIELETTRANASLEKLGIDKIWTYSSYLTNSGLDSSALSRGFKVRAKGDPIQQGKLACIKVTTSAGSR